MIAHKLKKLRRQILQKISRANCAGIYIMPFDDLAALALASPHWQKIGPHKGQYHFCRHNHSAGYTPTNTFIGLVSDNVKERNQRCGNPFGEDLTTLSAHERAERRRNQKRAADERSRHENPTRSRRRKREWYNNHREQEQARQRQKRRRAKQRARQLQQQTDAATIGTASPSNDD